MEQDSSMPKCSIEEHKESNAISYCQKCKIYMCIDCEKHHSALFKKHHQFKIENEEDIKDIFTGLCNVQNHNSELKFYCKTHNQLVCAECITIIKNKKIGHHKDCEISYIKEFQKQKQSKLNDNIKSLENLLIKLDESIIELKKIYEKICNNKEDLKMNILQIFTRIRNALNEREEE